MLPPSVRIFVCTAPQDMRRYAESDVMRSWRTPDVGVVPVAGVVVAGDAGEVTGAGRLELERRLEPAPHRGDAPGDETGALAADR